MQDLSLDKHLRMMKYAPQKGNEKAVLNINSRIRFLFYELNLGTPYYQGGHRFKGCDQVLVLKESKQAYERSLSHKVQKKQP